MTEDKARAGLAAFISHNPLAKIERAKVRGVDRIVVTNPWGDDSLQLLVPDDIAKFADALNGVYLPERYSAIWHRDTQDLECIYTAYPLLGERKVFRDRSFVFKHKGHEHNCGFGPASDDLMEIAKTFQPIFQSATGFRNIESLHFYTMHHKSLPDARPISFWIRSVPWDEAEVSALVNHLNFYLSYHDTRSPTILVWTPKSEMQASQPQTRYPAGKFPSHIASTNIDANLLHFWNAAQSGDAARRFTYYYRILEYASVAYLDATTRTAVRQILAAPNALDDIIGVTDRVVNAVPRFATQQQDAQRVNQLLDETLDPTLLWREIVLNLPAFVHDTKFDGDFELKAFVKATWGADDFKVKGIESFASYARNIRNALSHGRDQRSAGVIAPTTSNFQRLVPWASLMSVAASQVMLFRHTL